MGRLPVTGVVLAGGASRRMGRDKAFLDLGGRPLIAHVLERMAEVCAETLIEANDRSRYADLGARVVPDIFPGVGVLGGLHAGLAAAQHDLILAVGCDMPFLNPDLLRAFVAWAEGYDVVALRRVSRWKRSTPPTGAPAWSRWRRPSAPASSVSSRFSPGFVSATLPRRTFFPWTPISALSAM